MLKTRPVVWIIFAAMMVSGAGGVSGQTYPSKSIRIITSSVGGTNDFSARLLAPEISSRWGQPMVVQNLPTIVSIETAAKAEPDGYTLLISGATLWNAPFLQKVSYEPVRDFSPVTLLVRDPFLLVVHSSLPVKSVSELIALAKARPGELNYSAGAIGDPAHLGMELFKAMAGVKIALVNYKSTGPAVTGLVSGEVQLMITAPGAAAQYVKAGRLKALAVTGVRPSQLVPGIPTVAASGLPGYETASYVGFFAPGKTPAAIVTRLNQEIVRVVSAPETKEKYITAGIEAETSSPEELMTLMKSDMTKWGKVIKDAGIRVD